METIYIAGYFILACFALYSPLIFTILLIDGVKRSKDIHEMLFPISKNYIKLLKAAFLAASIIYFYAMIGMLFFQESYLQVLLLVGEGRIYNIYIYIAFIIIIPPLFIYPDNKNNFPFIYIYL